MGKYLDFYKKCMETGRIPPRGFRNANGLCNDKTVGSAVRVWFAPDTESLNDDDRNEGWWGTDVDCSEFEEVRYTFCARRQNIILLLAAIYGEDFSELSL